MNDGMKQLLIRNLAELKMFNAIELIYSGAEESEIIELFKKNVLYQNPHYQNMLLQPHMRMAIPQEQWDMMVDSWLKQQLVQNPSNFQTLHLLQLSNEDFDCGCS